MAASACRATASWKYRQRSLRAIDFRTAPAARMPSTSSTVSSSARDDEASYDTLTAARHRPMRGKGPRSAARISRIAGIVERLRLLDRERMHDQVDVHQTAGDVLDVKDAPARALHGCGSAIRRWLDRRLIERERRGERCVHPRVASAPVAVSVRIAAVMSCIGTPSNAATCSSASACTTKSMSHQSAGERTCTSHTRRLAFSRWTMRRKSRPHRGGRPRARPTATIAARSACASAPNPGEAMMTRAARQRHRLEGPGLGGEIFAQVGRSAWRWVPSCPTAAGGNHREQRTFAVSCR